jgi:tRNA (guanine9-N1)-methyltransferase
MESENFFENDFDFNPEFFSEQMINEEKLKRIDLNKEIKTKLYEDMKKEMRIKTKNKRKEIKKKKRQERIEIVSQMTKEERIKFYTEEEENLKQQENNLLKGMTSDYTIVFDMDYVHLMKIKEIKSLARQLGNCYNLNKKFITPFKYFLSNYEGEIKQECEAMGSKNWHCYFSETNFSDIKEITQSQSGKNLIYLSPDSNDILTEVNSNTIYIIGGFVDKPVSKWRSLNKASNLNIKTARLPLDEYLKDLANPVLNVNTVVEILGSYLEDSNFDRIKEIIPKRMMNI